MKKLCKPVSILLSFIMVFSLFTIIPFEVGAAGNGYDLVEYYTRSWDGSKVVEEHLAQATEDTVGKGGAVLINADNSSLDYAGANPGYEYWYYCDRNMTISGRLNVNSGTVNLILCDGARLNLGLGITVGENATLNIYGQKNNTGTLYCHIDKDNKDNGGYAIIGGGSSPNTGTINIHGGRLDLHTDGEIWGYRGACIGGGENGSPKAVTIYGGVLELYATGGACIGGGKYGAASRGDGNGVRIYGGTVNAKSDTGAGIGSGYNCGSSSGIIAIYGGTVTATGRNGGAGIGGGSGSGNCPISIYGGNVTASGIASKVTGSGIGSGRKADQSSSINISGAVVVATGQSGAGIGAAAGGNAGTINISGAVVTASSTAGGAGIGGGKRVDKKGGSGGNTTISNGSVVVATSSSYGSAQDFNNRLGQTISSSGMKTDASAYTVSAASAVSLLIDLFDKKISGTGIGGGYQGYAGNITIDNSTVTAKSGKNAAAIGSGDDAANGGEIVITNHSTVTATAGDDGAGIGGGNETKVNRIIINHSTVTSYGGDYAAGIGGGDAADGGFIELSESDVHAYGGKDGAGIGGGEGGYGGTIRIYESKVYAEGKHYGAGIGGGEDEGVSEVSVVGNCEVEAVAGSAGNGVAIGHGDFNKFWAWLTQNYPSNGTLSFDQKYYKVNAGSSKGGASLYTHDNTGNLSSVCQNKKYAKIYSCEHNDGTIMDYVSDRYHGQCCSYCGRTIQDLESHNWNSDNVCTVCGASANLIHVVFVERDNNGEVTRTVTMPRGYAYKLPESQKTPDRMQLYYWVDERGHEYQIGDEIVCEEKTYTAVYMPAVETTYIDQNGIQQSVTAIRLPKENCNLYTGWYIADYDTYDDEIGATYRMYGDVNVIIADDVTWSNKATKFYNYSDGEATFSLYGQKKQNGTFEYGGTSIGKFYNFIQYGGILKTWDIITENDFTFVGGSIDAHSVTAPNKIELGWTRWEDSIYIGYFYKSENSSASGYPEIVVAEGRPLINERDYIIKSGKQGNSQIHMMQGYIFSPYPDLSYARNPEWTWSDDGREAEALFTCPSNRDEDAVLQANITYAYEGIYRISTATVTFRNTTYTATKSVRIYWDVNMGSCEHGTMEFSSNSALTGSKVQVTVTPDKGYAVKSFEVIPSDNSSVVEVENNEFTMPDCSVIVNAEFVPVVPRIEPYIDENGEYHLGEVEYAEIDGAPYSVNADGSVGELLDSIELSYFDFALINNDSEYQIKYYTGPKGELSELVIPKTFNGKPITVLGSNTTDPLINYGDTPKTQFTLVLNENIREIKNHTFYTMWVKKVDGDTSNLSILGNYAFSWANSPDGYSLDIKLDYDGVINMGEGVFNNMNVTARMKHAASFTSYNLEQNRLSCIFTDAHLYDEPTWRWGESYNSASAVLACSDPRCDHEETAEAAITIDSRVDKTVYTAAATISGSTYTDVRTVTRTLSNISIADTEYGTITANRTEAYEGEEITLTADPDPFRELSTLSVKDSNNHDIEVTDNKFIMPDSDVTVQATFKKKTIGIEYVTSGHGTVTGPDTARPNERVLLTITADEGWALNNLYAEEKEWNDPVGIIDNELVMIDGLVTVYADFIPITPKTEPYIDENGEYHLGNIAYYESDGRYYAVENGFIGDQVDSVEFSYFDFTPIYYGTEYRIDHYTGPKEELSELVIPKSYDGKPITVLGNNTNDPLINYGDTPKTQFTLTLNENIREIKRYAFYTMEVTEVKGDTSNLSTLGDFAFSWANSSGDYTLDFKFDYKYKIDIERSVFNHMKVTARIKHATSFSSTDFGAQRVEYIFTDEHTYGDPVWTWTDDYSTATAKFTCADSRCRHSETVNATVTADDQRDKIIYTATAQFEGETYTDTKTVNKTLSNVNIANTEHGTVTADKTEAYEGEEVTLTVTPDTNYKLSALTVRDENDRDVEVTDGKFTIPDSAVTVTAVFAQKSHSISYEEADGGWISGAYSANYNDEIVLSVTPATGYELDTLTVTDSSENEIEVNNKKFTMPDSDVTVKVTFKKMNLSITYVTDGHGTVTGANTAQFNDRVPLTVTVDEGWALINLYAEEPEWNDPVEIIDNELVMIDSPVTVYAEFVQITPRTEPYIDANGEYHLGSIEHCEIGGDYFAVENGAVGSMIDSIEFSYFDFTDNGSTYQINYYTGPTDNLTELVIPKTYQGKPITVLGTDNRNAFIANSDPKPQFTLTLNENIREIKGYAFYVMWVTEVKGDTSNLKTIGDYAFSWANSPGSYKLDITLDYPGRITVGREIFNNMKVTARIKHATTFSSTSFSARSVDYIFTDAHTCGNPVWTWTDDHSTATAKFTCADSRCKHEETVNAAITSETKDGIITYTATAELDGNTYNDVKTAFADGVGVRIVGHSISLDGDIAVNFYMDLSDSIIAHKDTAYMHFTIPTGSGTTEQDMLVKDARVVESGDKTYYVFKCRVAAKEMTSEIKAQMIDGENEGVIYTYSVKEYADYLLTHAHEREDLAAAAPLVKKLLNYGAYAQIYFDKNPGTLANSDLAAADKAFSDPEIDIAAPDESKLPEGVTFEGATLSLKSETTLSLYFKSSDPLEFSCDGYTVEKATSGGYQIARIRGIKAKHIGDVLTLKIGEEETISYSPLNYCKNVLDDDTTDEKLINVVKALYLYWQAADVYFKS